MSQDPAAFLAKITEPNSRSALEYCILEKELVKHAAHGGFAADGWSPLAELVAADSFERVGNYRERVNWEQYCQLLADLGTKTTWDFEIVRVVEGENLAVVERAERLVWAGKTENCGTVSIFEFDKAGKVQRLTVYAQLEKRHMAGLAEAWDLEAVKAEIAQDHWSALTSTTVE